MLDLKDPEGLRASRALIRTADVVLHNLPPDRARRFELDRESVREVNPAAVWCCVSALGSDGPEAELTAFDLVAQALSGLLVADAHPTPTRSPARRRDRDGRLHGRAAGGDRRARRPGRSRARAARGLEVSLLGAALAVQAQRFVSVERLDRGGAQAGPAAGDRR